ncbi:MAG: hypothetical protein ACOY0T_26225 [Myxococcota bacterium]
MAAKVRVVGGALAVVFGIGIFLAGTTRHVPIGEWLFWRIAGCWLASGVFVGVSIALGDAIVTWVRGGKRLPMREQLAMSFAVGALGFGVGVFGFGILHLLRGGFFFWYPALLGVVFVPRFGFAYLPLIRRVLRRGVRLPASAAWVLPLLAVGLTLAYFPLLTLNNLTYDARWYHLPAAEHYAAAGGIERFPEGWLLGAYPQLGTMFYTWAMTLPVGRLFDRAMLCVHIEWAMFVATLVSVPPLVRRLAPKLSGKGAVLAMFLFPGMLLYDSSLGAGADHLCAAFAPAIWLSLLRAWPRLEVRASVLFAVALAAACLTKYTALAMVAPAGLAFGGRALWLTLRGLRREAPVSARAALRGAFAFLGVLLLVTSVHWLKNIVFYRDPLFPLLNKWITPNPWSDYAKWNYDYLSHHKMSAAPHNWQGAKAMVETAFTFAFQPHDWGYSHRDIPVFGLLFTLSLLVIPFVKPRARIAGLALACEVGVMIWFWTHHLDRFLQALVPWMAAVTAAVIGLLWQRGWLTRALVFVWASLQVVWGGDHPFIPTHSMLGDSPYRDAVRFLTEGYKQNYEGRLMVADLEEIGSTTPKGSKLVVHQAQIHLGLGRMSVNDSPHSQTGLDYSVLDSRSLYELFRSWKVTHILMLPQPSDIEWDNIAGNLVLANFLDRYAGAHYKLGSWTVYPMPSLAPPQQPQNPTVFYAGCNNHDRYRSGLYQLRDMRRVGTEPYASPREAEVLDNEAVTRSFMERADYLVVDNCRRGMADRDEFKEIYRRPEAVLYRRK